MYKIRLKKQDVLNGLHCEWFYFQDLNAGTEIITYRVKLSFYKHETDFIVSIEHLTVAGVSTVVNYKFSTYEKARKTVSVLNKFYG